MTNRYKEETWKSHITIDVPNWKLSSGLQSDFVPSKGRNREEERQFIIGFEKYAQGGRIGVNFGSFKRAKSISRCLVVWFRFRFRFRFGFGFRFSPASVCELGSFQLKYLSWL